MRPNDKTFYQIFKENIIYLLVLGGGILISYNLLVTSNNLKPLEQNMAITIQRVDAIEKDVNTCATKDFMTEAINTIKEDVKEIKNRQITIEGKLDNHILKGGE